MTSYNEIILADMDAWEAFAEANLDAINADYGSVANALQHAMQGRLVLGGGAAPEFFISFAE